MKRYFSLLSIDEYNMPALLTLFEPHVFTTRTHRVLKIHMSLTAFFLTGKISPQKTAIKKWSDFEGFELPEVGEKFNKNHKISIFGFQCVAINIEGWLNKDLYFISSFKARLS
jgi:hypothetical protein